MRCLFAVALALTVGLLTASAEDATPAAAKTKDLLKTKVTLNFKDTRLGDIVEELKEEHVKGLRIRLDSKGGVSQNRKFSLSCKETPLQEALEKMISKEGLGWVIISNKANAYDGALLIKVGTEKGDFAK